MALDYQTLMSQVTGYAATGNASEVQLLRLGLLQANCIPDRGRHGPMQEAAEHAPFTVRLHHSQHPNERRPVIGCK